MRHKPTLYVSADEVLQTLYASLRDAGCELGDQPSPEQGLAALRQVVIFKRGTSLAEKIAPITQMDVLTLVNVEGELISTLRDGQVDATEDSPYCENVRDLHVLIQRVHPEHYCSLDDDLAQATKVVEESEAPALLTRVPHDTDGESHHCDNCTGDDQATCFYITEDGAPFFLCSTCREAFALGQANPEAAIQPLDLLMSALASE
jgi:hypothetical protein